MRAREEGREEHHDHAEGEQDDDEHGKSTLHTIRITNFFIERQEERLERAQLDKRSRNAAVAIGRTGDDDSGTDRNIRHGPAHALRNGRRGRDENDMRTAVPCVKRNASRIFRRDGAGKKSAASASAARAGEARSRKIPSRCLELCAGEGVL